MVGLVDRGDLDRAERTLALPNQVEQPARGRDQQVDAAAQRGDLPAHRRAAVDGEHPHAHRLTERGQRVLHLAGQLARRHQHQSARGAGRAAGCAGEPG